MIDIWMEALEKGDITAVIMLDMSAAFDVVDHDILLDKLKLYGLQNQALSWVKSYLSGRSQQVYCDGNLSESLDLEAGVPQGSILGPLCYVIFSNDLPESIHNHTNNIINSVDNNRNNENEIFNIHCQECGGICCFADDSSYSKSSSDPETLKADIKVKYKEIASYMSKNKLVLIGDKTHLMLLTTDAARRRMAPTDTIVLNTGNEIVEPTECEILLGGAVFENLKWTHHILLSSGSLVKQLGSRLNALRKIARVADFKTRKMLANGLFMSKMIYLIPVLGGCEKYLINALQIIQNKAARFVTKLGIFTPVRVLLKQCS